MLRSPLARGGFYWGRVIHVEDHCRMYVPCSSFFLFCLISLPFPPLSSRTCRKQQTSEFRDHQLKKRGWPLWEMFGLMVSFEMLSKFSSIGATEWACCR